MKLARSARLLFAFAWPVALVACDSATAPQPDVGVDIAPTFAVFEGLQQFSFTGVISGGVGSPFGVEWTAGDVISGTLTYDASVAATSEGVSLSRYDQSIVGGITMVVGGREFSSNTFTVFVENDRNGGPLDGYNADSNFGGDLFDGGSPVDGAISVNALDFTGAVLSSTLLAELDPTLFQSNAQLLQDDDNFFQASLELTRVGDPPTPFGCPNVAEIPAVECEALVALYDATNGDDWADNSGWLETNHPCSWFAVVCVDGSVYQLNFFRNNLVGEIPSEIGDLSNLQALGFNEQHLTGPIPPELGRLSRLEYLLLGRNQLSGTIPAELGDLGSLRVLRLDLNQLTGQIPPELGMLSSLETLRLRFNQLSGEIPPELGNLSRLTTLLLDLNQLSGEIPPELGNLASLGSLSLASNELTGSIPAALSNLSSLGSLTLRDNQLSGPIPAEVGGMSGLAFIDLGQNQLTGSIPAELGALSGLGWLSLRENQLTGTLPSSLGNLEALRNLQLYGNQLEGTMPLAVAELGGALGVGCNMRPGNPALVLPDVAAYRAFDLDGDGLICRVPFSVVDSDGDGVFDSEDACPDTPGEATNSGCPTPPDDSDGDGVPNSVDACAGEYGIRSRDGCPAHSGQAEDVDLLVKTTTFNATAWPRVGPVVWWHVSPAALIENRGGTDSGRFDVRFEFGGTGGSYWLAHVKNVPAGGELWVYPPFEQNVAPGTFDFTTIVDPHNTVPELDEGNNVYVKQVLLLGR